jgi:hypothetical protein
VDTNLTLSTEIVEKSNEYLYLDINKSLKFAIQQSMHDTNIPYWFTQQHRKISY